MQRILSGILALSLTATAHAGLLDSVETHRPRTVDLDIVNYDDSLITDRSKCVKSYFVKRRDTCGTLIFFKYHRSLTIYRSLNSRFCDTSKLYVGQELCVPWWPSDEDEAMGFVDKNGDG